MPADTPAPDPSSQRCFIIIDSWDGDERLLMTPIGGIPLIEAAILDCLEASDLGETVVVYCEEAIANVARKFGIRAIDASRIHSDESPLSIWGADTSLPNVTVDPYYARRPLGAVGTAAKAALTGHAVTSRKEYQVIRNGHDETLSEAYVFAPSISARPLSTLSAPPRRYIDLSPAESMYLYNEHDIPLVNALIRAEGLQRPSRLFAEIGALILDFDGVMSTNSVFTDQDGRESVECSRSDGLGIGMLKARGTPVCVISKEQNPVVAARCRKLGLPCFQGIDDKLTKMREYLASVNIELSRTAYVGNDLNDLPCMREVGFPIAVGDAYDDVIDASMYITRKLGGRGAVREVIDLMLAASSLSRE